MCEDKSDPKSIPASALEKYKTQMARHDHEWTILAGRVQTFLTSQSLFATGAALLTVSQGDQAQKLNFISFIGYAIAVCASIAIAINCHVIRKWHEQIQNLIRDNKAELDGYYMPREQPDYMHTISVDVMSVGLCFITGCAWAIVFCHDKAAGIWAFFSIFTVAWAWLISRIYNLTIK